MIQNQKQQFSRGVRFPGPAANRTKARGQPARELLNPVGQLLNPFAHTKTNTSISTTTTRLGLVVRMGRVGVGVPLGAVPLGTKRDQEGTSYTCRRPWKPDLFDVRGTSR